MLRIFSRDQSTDILSHWFTVTDSIQFSGEDFYASIEDDLAARELPRLHATRVASREGGLLSGKRVYLRLARERYAFDVCAAPFGTGYFFSLRLVQLPRTGWLGLFLILTLTPVLFLILLREIFFSSNALVPLALVAVIATAIYAFTRSSSIGEAPSEAPAPDAGNVPPPQTGPLGEMPDFDAFILNLPLFGEV